MEAVVVGATGLIGSYLVDLLVKDDSFTKVRLLVRQWKGDGNPKLEIVPVDFGNPDSLREKTGRGDVLFCSIGTTNKKVGGDLAEYRKVDVDIPVAMAQIGARNGFKKFVLISAVGASSKAKNYYLQFKGEVEDIVTTVSYDSIHIFRPSLLIGDRKEKRIGEGVGKLLSPLLGLFLWGSWSKYRAIHAGMVARAMIFVAKSNVEGVNIYEYDEMRNSMQN